MNLSILNKVNTLESLIKEIEDNLNSEKVRKKIKIIRSKKKYVNCC
jgi:hypothetical protein